MRNGLLILFFMALSSAVSGGDLYKWQDAEGIWHFSSLPPENGEDYATVEVPAESRPLVTIRKLGPEREPEYAFINNTWGPVELELDLADRDNVTTDPAVPARLVLPAQSEQRLLRIRAQDPAKGFSFRLSYKSMIGAPLAQLPPEVDYYPPFPLGLRFPISQGFDNDVTHNDPPNQYAVDIVMPVGTPVLAARAGRVIELEDNFHGAAQEQRYMNRSNMIRVLHDDGTMSVYAHLQANSLRVRRGQMVGTGEWIANSGNTGYSSGPHLHFVVQLNAGMSLESLPFRFHTPNGGNMTPGQQMVIDGVLRQR